MEKLISVKELSLNFNLREPKGNKLTNVYCVVKCGNRQFKFSTRCKVNSWQWNKKQQMPTISPNMSEEDRTGKAENPRMPMIIEHLTTDEEYVASVQNIRKRLADH